MLAAVPSGLRPADPARRLRVLAVEGEGARLRIESENSPVPTDPVVPAGLWNLSLNNLALSPPETIEAWVQRDDAPVGYPRRGRQAYFDIPSYEIYGHDGRPLEEDDPACPVKRSSSMNAIATGKDTSDGAPR